VDPARAVSRIGERVQYVIRRQIARETMPFEYEALDQLISEGLPHAAEDLGLVAFDVHLAHAHSRSRMSSNPTVQRHGRYMLGAGRSIVRDTSRHPGMASGEGHVDLAIPVGQRCRDDLYVACAVHRKILCQKYSVAGDRLEADHRATRRDGSGEHQSGRADVGADIQRDRTWRRETS
jgi:hypothetical protein